MHLFFVNKFALESASPMAAVSVFSTYSLASRGVRTTLIIEGNTRKNLDTVLKERFGCVPLPAFSIKVYSRYVLSLRVTTIFYLRASLFILGHRMRGKHCAVISRNTTFLPYLMLLRLFGCAVFFETHAYHGRRSLPGLPDAPRRWMFTMASQYYFLERLLLNRCNGCICITKSQTELYANDFLKAPVITLPLGSPQPFGVKPLLDGPMRRHLVYIGRKAASVEDALIFNALALCRQHGITFAWLGLRPGDVPALSAQAENYGVADIVTLKLWMPHPEMSAYLASYGGAGLASYRRNFMTAALVSPTKVFDFFAAALPVIAADLPTLSAFVREGREGVLYEPGSMNALSQAMVRLFSDEARYRTMRETCIAAALEHSWDKRAEKLEAFIYAQSGKT
jgi:glycosyltransferase involved in cell wall biosynthesis